jgi:TPR repeat protein
MRIARLFFTAPLAAVLFMPLPVLAGFNEGVLAFESEDYPAALKEFMPLAKTGQPAAMTYVGRIFEEQDKLAEAAVWYQKAAQKGFADAQTQLAQLYESGEGVPKDEARAMELYAKAAAQGDDEAQLALGEHAEDDLNDNKTAQQWYEKAAAQDNPDAQYRLGLLLISDEEGVVRDVPHAWMYLSLAAEHDNDDALQARDVLELEMEPVEVRGARKLLDAWKKTH